MGNHKTRNITRYQVAELAEKLGGMPLLYHKAAQGLKLLVIFVSTQM
jgi:hypothetical protein